MKRTKLPNLPKPECHLGYTDAQIEKIMGDRIDEFHAWMVGQTGAICTGMLYNHETKQYEEDCGTSHGMTCYPWDVKRFLQGLPVID